MQSQTHTLVIERTFDATPEEMWAAWTRPERVAKWWNPAAGIDADVHELDLRVGGALRLTMTVPEGVELFGTDKFPVHGVFVRIDPPHALVLGLKEGDDGSGDTTLAVSFERVGARTRLRFTVTPLPDVQTRDMLDEGWNACFDNLDHYLDHAPQEDTPMQTPATPAVRLERLLDCAPEALFAAFTRPEHLAKWISPFPGLDAEVHELDARVGGRIRFTMVDPQGNRYPEEEGIFETMTPHEIVQYQPNEKRDDVFKGHPQRIRALFESVGNKTRLVVEVYGMPPQIPVADAAQGFGACLAKLEALVAKRGPAPLRLERTFDATPQELWAAWTDPAQYAKWLNPAPGMDLVIHEWDLRVGGRVRFDMPQPDGNLNPQEGVFHVLSPYTRLVSGNDDKTFLLEVEFQPRGTRTHLVLDITGVPPEWQAAATVGWGQCLDKLEVVLKQHRV